MWKLDKGGESRSRKRKLPMSVVIQVRNDESMNCGSEDEGDRFKSFSGRKIISS